MTDPQLATNLQAEAAAADVEESERSQLWRAATATPLPYRPPTEPAFEQRGNDSHTRQSQHFLRMPWSARPGFVENGSRRLDALDGLGISFSAAEKVVSRQRPSARTRGFA